MKEGEPISRSSFAKVVGAEEEGMTTSSPFTAIGDGDLKVGVFWLQMGPFSRIFFDRFSSAASMAQVLLSRREEEEALALGFLSLIPSLFSAKGSTEVGLVSNLLKPKFIFS
jgi:hypothetical protein